MEAETDIRVTDLSRSGSNRTDALSERWRKIPITLIDPAPPVVRGTSTRLAYAFRSEDLDDTMTEMPKRTMTRSGFDF